MLTGAEAAEVHPLLMVCRVTEAVAETLMLWVVSPVLQRYPPEAKGAISVTLPPWQKLRAPPTVMAGVAGSGVTETCTGADAAEVHPLKTV